MMGQDIHHCLTCTKTWESHLAKPNRSFYFCYSWVCRGSNGSCISLHSSHPWWNLFTTDPGPAPWSCRPLLKYASRGFDSMEGRNDQHIGKKSGRQSHGIAPVGPLQTASHPCSAWFGRWTSNLASCILRQIPTLIKRGLVYWLSSSPSATLISSQDAFGS